MSLTSSNPPPTLSHTHTRTTATATNSCTQPAKRVVPRAFSVRLRDEPTRFLAWCSLAGEETARAYLRKAPALFLERGGCLQTAMASMVALLDGDVLAAKKVRNPHTASRLYPGASPMLFHLCVRLHPPPDFKPLGMAGTPSGVIRVPSW
jgi:hypothetical protein